MKPWMRILKAMVRFYVSKVQAKRTKCGRSGVQFPIRPKLLMISRSSYFR